jgi:hypothetical protein
MLKLVVLLGGPYVRRKSMRVALRDDPFAKVSSAVNAGITI